jgi:hypothetical protein
MPGNKKKSLEQEKYRFYQHVFNYHFPILSTYYIGLPSHQRLARLIRITRDITPVTNA